jgi:hypothetical protein
MKDIRGAMKRALTREEDGSCDTRHPVRLNFVQGRGAEQW